MKKLNIIGFIFLMMVIFTGCKEENILFNIEQPQFELREGYMLLEIIAPWDTGEGDNIYIYGAFNGGFEEAIGNPRWKLEKGPGSSVQESKWGIYLDPKTFENGKTLSDGYSFYSIQQGEERGEGNVPVLHKDYPALGQRLNVLVPFWEEYFNKVQTPDDITHDGFVIYVLNSTGWDDLALYAWNDNGDEPFGSWPGILPTGKVQINGQTFQYFDTGVINEGLGVNLIFNNNNNGSQLDDYWVTLDKDYYLEITGSQVLEYDPDAVVEHDGYTVYVVDLTGWDALYLYTWGDVNDLHGAWPGMAPSGTEVINGVTYTYFDLGAANSDAGLSEHVILNDNAGHQIDDVVVFSIDRDVYIELTSSKATEIDPDTYVPSDPGTSDPEPGETHNLYIKNNTGWETLYVYAYGAESTDFVFGSWPGETSEMTSEIGGDTYMVFPFAAGEEVLNIIFSDGTNEHQYFATTITADQDYYLVANPTSATSATLPTCNIYVEDQTGWDELYLYSWYGTGDASFGSWPGVKATVTTSIGGVTYYHFSVLATGAQENLIFNNNAGSETASFNITLNDQDYYLVVTPTTVSIKQ